MKYVAMIPARSGSKGIPGKNIKPIAGKPLIAWSIEQALGSKHIDKVVVSTDSEAIAEVSMKYGADVPFIRPQSISSDTATTESAMLHCCEWFESQGEPIKNLILVQCTSPVRSSGRFDDAIRFFEEGGYTSILTVTETHRFFWKNPDSPTASYDYRHRPRRQDIPFDERMLMETGSFYITNTRKLIESNNRLCGKIGVYETPENESFEIDTPLDFSICETLLKESFGEN